MELKELQNFFVNNLPEKQTRLERILCAIVSSGEIESADQAVMLAGRLHEALHNYEFSDDSDSEKFPDKICCWGEVEGYVLAGLHASELASSEFSSRQLESLAHDIAQFLRSKYEQ